MNAFEPEGFAQLPNTLTFNIAGTPVLDDAGVAHFNLQVERTSEYQIDPQQTAALSRGLTPKTAANVLKAKLPLAKAPEIVLFPSWWPWLPLNPFGIKVH